METTGYKERIMTTSNTKLAAVLRAFGAKLRRHMPAEWIDEFPSKEAYLAYRRNPALKPKATVFFNFEPDGVDVKAIVEAFNGQGAEEIFSNLVNDTSMDEKARARILLAHSKAVAAACREALAQRESLIQLMREFPESAKWNSVRGARAGQEVRFGKTASKETIAEQLNKLG